MLHVFRLLPFGEARRSGCSCETFCATRLMYVCECMQMYHVALPRAGRCGELSKSMLYSAADVEISAKAQAALL